MFTGGWRRAWFGRGRDPLHTAFGHLERDVMDVIWRGSTPRSVRDVQASLSRPIAYTTVMTTLDRLFKKGCVRREQRGRAFLYTATLSRTELESALAAGLLTGFLQHGHGPARPILSNLVDAVAEGGDALLDELEALVRQKRRDAKGARHP